MSEKCHRQTSARLALPPRHGATINGEVRFTASSCASLCQPYALLAAGISLAIIAVVNGLGTKLNTKFTSINTSLK
jgi:pilus assembly protein Flp/PilA